MPLLTGKHDDEPSAALSMVRNRASKIDKLIEEGHISTARTFAGALLADVLEWTMVAPGSFRKANFFTEIGETAFQAYVRAREAKATLGEGEQVVNVPCLITGSNRDGDLAKLEVLDGASWPGPEIVWMAITKVKELQGERPTGEADDEPRFWVLDSANDDNRIDEVAREANMPLIGIVDEQAGGIVAYALEEFADATCKTLNEGK